MAMSVANVFKELTTVGIGMWMLADKVTLTNVLGFITSQAGIVCYAVLKYREDLDLEEPSLKATVSLPAHQLHPCPISSVGAGGGAGTGGGWGGGGMILLLQAKRLKGVVCWTS